MNKNMLRIISIVIASFLCSNNLLAQESTVFGFFQGTASTIATESAQFNPFAGGKVTTKENNSTFNLQQANLMVNSLLGEGFSAFINLEFTNNYSSDKSWGTFNLQEVYVTYSSSRELKIKGGLFIPKFNSMYEIYNRTPLLPYITRPLIYETSFYGIIDPEDFLPARALLQLYGTTNFGSTKFDYALFLGSAEASYRTGDDDRTAGSAISGYEQTKHKTIGARLGIRHSSLNVGVSSTYDRDNLNSINVAFGGQKMRSLGDVPRIRLGADFEYSISGLTLSGEVISVLYSLTDENKDSLTVWSQPVIPTVENSVGIGDELDKLFYFANLKYEFLEKYFVYGLYSNYSNNGDNVFASKYGGMNQISFGCGFKPSDSVVLKFQWSNFKIETDLIDYESTQTSVGVSVSF